MTTIAVTTIAVTTIVVTTEQVTYVMQGVMKRVVTVVAASGVGSRW